MENTWLSIIVPTHNGERYLKETFESVILQKDTSGIEVIVIDDDSSDATLDIVNSFSSEINIKLINRRSGNWAGNTNNAFSSADGKYICFLHQDDIWLNGRLSIIKELMEKHPDIDLFLFPSLFIDGNQSILGEWKNPLAAYPDITKKNILKERLLVQNFIFIGAPVFTKHAAESVGYLDEKLWYTPDWDFWLKLSDRYDALYYPVPFTGFRLHSASQTFKKSKNVKDFEEQMKIVLKKHLNSLDVPDKEKNSIEKVSRFSIKVNTMLAGRMHGVKCSWLSLLIDFIILGPIGWYKYIHYSRIFERTLSRLKLNSQSR